MFVDGKLKTSKKLFRWRSRDISNFFGFVLEQAKDKWWSCFGTLCQEVPRVLSRTRQQPHVNGLSLDENRRQKWKTVFGFSSANKQIGSSCACHIIFRAIQTLNWIYCATLISSRCTRARLGLPCTGLSTRERFMTSWRTAFVWILCKVMIFYAFIQTKRKEKFCKAFRFEKRRHSTWKGHPSKGSFISQGLHAKL